MTAKQRKFFRVLVRTFEPTEAAMQSYNCKDRKVARVIASQLLTKLNIDMQNLMDIMGLDTESDIKLLDKLRNAKITKHFAHEGKVVDKREYNDNTTQLKALELSLKLKGRLKDGFGDVNIGNIELKPEKAIIFTDIDQCDRITKGPGAKGVHAQEGPGGTRPKIQV